MAGLRARSRAYLIGLGCFAVGLTLASPIADAASAFKDVVVQNSASNPVPVTPQGTTHITGTVDAGNLPIENGRVAVAAPERELRSGSGDTFLSADQRLVIPAGVVLTDIKATPDNRLSQRTESCVGALRERDADGRLVGAVATFVTSPANPHDELHLTSGVLAQPGRTLDLEMIDGTDDGCAYFWTWTGYVG